MSEHTEVSLIWIYSSTRYMCWPWQGLPADCDRTDVPCAVTVRLMALFWWMACAERCGRGWELDITPGGNPPDESNGPTQFGGDKVCTIFYILAESWSILWLQVVPDNSTRQQTEERKRERPRKIDRVGDWKERQSDMGRDDQVNREQKNIGDTNWSISESSKGIAQIEDKHNVARWLD